MLRLIRLSIGGMFQYFVGMASWIGLVRMVASFGSAAVAGYTLAMRIIIFAILPVGAWRMPPRPWSARTWERANPIEQKNRFGAQASTTWPFWDW